MLSEVTIIKNGNGKATKMIQLKNRQESLEMEVKKNRKA